MKAPTGKIKITQIKSGIGQLKRKKLTLKALGITKPGRSVVQSDTPCIRGMVNTVSHLVKVETASGE
jgi:large subunit ribosomal protein L30